MESNQDELKVNGEKKVKVQSKNSKEIILKMQKIKCKLNWYILNLKQILKIKK